MPCNFNRKYENLKFMEIKDRKDIITLVDTFYKKVLKDEYNSKSTNIKDIWSITDKILI